MFCDHDIFCLCNMPRLKEKKKRSTEKKKKDSNFCLVVQFTRHYNMTSNNFFTSSYTGQRLFRNTVIMMDTI